MARDSIPVYGIELLLKGQESQTKGIAGWHQTVVTSAAILWQKEALVNEVVRRLPAGIRYVAEVDADVWFQNALWSYELVDVLKRHPLAQPFARAIWTGPNGLPETERMSAAKAGFCMEKWKGHTGFSWAFCRDFFEAVEGFFPLAPLGGGDLLWSAACLTPEVDFEGLVIRTGLGSDACFRPWVENFKKVLGSDTPGFVDGNLYHEYHGSRRNRRYTERAAILSELDPVVDIERHPNGHLIWTTSANRDMVNRVARYFVERREDE